MKTDTNDGKGAQYASAIRFLVVELMTDDGCSKDVPIVCKTQIGTEKARDFMDTDTQFTIEVMAYDKILPFLQTEGLAPKMHFGCASCGKDPSSDLIILEDLRSRGFHIAKQTFLDVDVLSLTMRNLGEFHGASYKIKKTKLLKLQRLVNELPRRKYDDCDSIFKGALLRGFAPFLKQENVVAVKAYNLLSSESLPKLWNNASKPEEPFAVIAHGDFNKNNVLYSHNELGKVDDVKFFDFATLGYFDPATDIAFLLYMNASEDLRDQHFDDLLATYWEGVTSVESDPGFNYQEFLNNFNKKSVYGLLPCSFFLPMVLFPEAELTPEKFVELSDEERFEWGRNSAGEKGDAVIVSIVKHLLNRGCLDDLEYLKENSVER